MAYTPARGDTRIAGSVGGTASESKTAASASPINKLISSQSTTVQRPRFRNPTLPRAQAGTPIKKTSVERPIGVGRRNPTDDGNPLSKSITNSIKRLAGAVDFDQLFSDTFASSNEIAATNLVTDTESFSDPFSNFTGGNTTVSDAEDFGGFGGGSFGGGTPTPSAFSSPGFFRDGGFIRRKS